jgi:hypothetical protein
MLKIIKTYFNNSLIKHKPVIIINKPVINPLIISISWSNGLITALITKSWFPKCLESVMALISGVCHSIVLSGFNGYQKYVKGKSITNESSRVPRFCETLHIIFIGHIVKRKL